MTWPKKKISASTDLWFNACELNKPVIYLLQFDYLNAVYNKVGNEKKKNQYYRRTKTKASYDGQFLHRAGATASKSCEGSPDFELF